MNRRDHAGSVELYRRYRRHHRCDPADNVSPPQRAWGNLNLPGVRVALRVGDGSECGRDEGMVKA